MDVALGDTIVGIWAAPRRRHRPQEEGGLQRGWIKTRMKQAAPQALLVAD